MYFSCCGTLVLRFEWEQESTDIHRNSDSYQHSSMSTKSCQVARYLIPPSSVTSFGNLGCMPNRHLDYCKNSGEVCVTECHWSMLLERRGVRTDLWYQCGNKRVRAQIAKGANVMAVVVRRDERARCLGTISD